MKWDYVLVSVVDEEPFVSETLWENGDEGWELVSAYPKDGSVKLYFKRQSVAPLCKDCGRPATKDIAASCGQHVCPINNLA